MHFPKEFKVKQLTTTDFLLPTSSKHFSDFLPVFSVAFRTTGYSLLLEIPPPFDFSYRNPTGISSFLLHHTSTPRPVLFLLATHCWPPRAQSALGLAPPLTAWSLQAGSTQASLLCMSRWLTHIHPCSEHQAHQFLTWCVWMSQVYTNWIYLKTKVLISSLAHS